MKSNVKVVPGFPIGALGMLAWIALWNVLTEGDASSISPSPVWAKMVIGGVIGLLLFSVFFRRD